MAVKEKEVTAVESYTWMTSDRACDAPAVAFGISAKQRGSGVPIGATGTAVRTHSTNDVLPGLYVWSSTA